MAHEFDFYKPVPASEYPVVDGQHSINCYIEAIASCYTELKKRLGFKKVEDIASFMAFHSPFYKMVKKSFQKMMHMDLQATKDNLQGLELEAAQLDYKEKRCQELLNTVTQEKWDRLVEASTFMGKNIGNTYCGALPFSLLSLIYFQREKLLGKRIMLFSYGSGLSSSLFTISVASNAGPVIGKILQNNPLEATLSARIKLNPVEYNRRMGKREQDYVRNNFQPEDPVEELREGTFYLVRVDNKWRRFYARKITQSKL
jgi:hydroxymethylglutaryl-CoA synthase